MERAFVISGVRQNGKEERLAGVYFGNDEPSCDTLMKLGFTDLHVVEEVRPLSKQPTEPTLYLYEDSNVANSIEVLRLDAEGGIINRQKAAGAPHSLIPPVEGEAADSLLYRPLGYLIKATRGKPPSSIIGLLVIKPEPGGSLLPNKKLLQQLGFGRILSVDQVTVDSREKSSMLFIVDKDPSADSVEVAALCPKGSKKSGSVVSGHPGDTIPPIRGTAADMYFNSLFRTGPVMKDLAARPQKPAGRVQAVSS